MESLGAEMSVEASDWVMEQAATSARFLNATPVELLGPAGRALRAMAADWAAEFPDLHVVADDGPSDTRTSSTTRSRKVSVGKPGDGQMPLLQEVETRG
jgi:hypothetical protein